MKKVDLTGQRFGRLTVIKRIGTKYHQSLWLCKCDCGNTKEVICQNLKHGSVRSCGCLLNEARKKVGISNDIGKLNYRHGDFGTHLYGIWNAMKNRCLNTKSNGYKWYGARGIKVCDEWLDYTNFKQWAIKNGYNDGLSIERVDVNGNYEPSNCIWIKKREQGFNKRTTRYIQYRGKNYTIREISEITGLSIRTIRGRVERGCTPDEIFSPKLKKNQYDKSA